MTAAKVLDSFAVIAFFENEPGAEQVGKMLKQARDDDAHLLMSVVNWGEVYYILKRASGVEAAERALSALATLPVAVVPADADLTLAAARIKSERKMSYADCFAAALAKTRKAELVTGDREFEEVAGQVKIAWLKR